MSSRRGQGELRARSGENAISPVTRSPCRRRRPADLHAGYARRRRRPRCTAAAPPPRARCLHGPRQRRPERRERRLGGRLGGKVQCGVGRIPYASGKAGPAAATAAAPRPSTVAERRKRSRLAAPKKAIHGLNSLSTCEGGRRGTTRCRTTGEQREPCGCGGEAVRAAHLGARLALVPQRPEVVGVGEAAAP